MQAIDLHVHELRRELACPSPKRVRVEFRANAATIHRMLELLIVVVRALTLALRGHRELVLETSRCGNSNRNSVAETGRTD